MTLTKRARKLRSQTTEAEKRLWKHLRNRQLDDCKFYRQYPIFPYYVDFICRDRKLIIEVDGGQHNESKSDAKRTAFLEEKGYTVIRFWNNDVLRNTEGVLFEIQSVLQSLTPTLSLKGEGVREVAA